MTSTSTAPHETGPRVRARRERSRRKRWPLYTVLGVLVVLLAAGGIFAYWLGTGLLDASRVVQDKAALAQAELSQFSATLKAGDKKAAASHLRAGQARLDEAKDAAQVKQVRIAKGLPYVGNTVSDLDHLLAAAGIMTDSGKDALKVYEEFSGEDSKLYSQGTFSIPAMQNARTSVAALATAMDRAGKELAQVHGNGPKGDQALEKKQGALGQIRSLRGEVVALGPVLEAMPSAVGAGGKKTYLVAIMNPAEMRASGGAPLSVAFVKFKDGKMSIPLKGTTSLLTNFNAKRVFPVLENDPWQKGAGIGQRFVNTNFNPSFPMSAEEMVRATPRNFGVKVDGVIALDVVAISHLLKVTGPIASDGYGELNADNLAHKLLVGAYKKQTDQVLRHDINDQLMSIMLSRLTEGGGLIGKAKALGEAIPGRHLQLYLRDDRLQNLVLDKKLGGAVPLPEAGNLSAVYTQNANGSKMDVFQDRTVKETVRLRKDGSAVVRRTVLINNDSPRYVGFGPDPKTGYVTRWAGNLVINLMPKGAKVIQQPTAAAATGTTPKVSTITQGVDQDGRTFAQARVDIPPDGSATLAWTYIVKHAASRHGDGLRLSDFIAPQSILRTPTYQLTVVAPRGWTATASKAWKQTAKGITRAVPMDRVQELSLQVSPK